jgi:putative ABC transport system permease protein
VCSRSGNAFALMAFRSAYRRTREFKFMIPLKYNLRSLMVRRTTSIMTASGIAFVVLIMVLLLSLVGGLRKSLEAAGERGNWIVLSRGTSSETESFIRRAEFDVLRTRPEIAVGDSGEPLISPEVVVPFNAAVKRPANQFRAAYLRGVRPIAYRVHRRLKLVKGRWPLPGREEMAIGVKQAAHFPELGVGSRFRYGRRNWTIVGVFADRGSARESEFLADLDVLEQDARFENGFSSFHVVMRPGMEDRFQKALTNDSRLTVEAIDERTFYAAQAAVANQLRSLVLVVALLVGTGAAFGGMNTMYAAVARRSREVGVLRSLGFGKDAVLASFVIESGMLGVAGGIAGEIAALLALSVFGVDRRLMSVGAVVFFPTLNLSACAAGLSAAGLIGAAGGLLPAWRASRIRITESLREA